MNMGEIEFIEEIEDSLKKGTYEDLLCGSELKLKNLFERYIPEDVLTLINATIIFHNYNMICKEIDYSEYQENKHMSLRLIMSLPQFYYENISSYKSNRIENYDVVMDELIQIVIELQSIYYYYPCRNQREFVLDNENQFYMNYFKSYYLDYPYMDMENFLQFFKTNSKLCEEVLGDDTFNDSLKLMLYLQNLEENVKKDKFSPNLFLSKDARKIINAQSLILLYPINVVKKICYNSKINFADFMKKYAYDLEDRNENDVKLIDILIKSKDKRFLFKTPKFVFFPRNVFWMHKLYDLVWKSKNLKKNLPNGKTIKSAMQERALFEILKKYFGENNVYANVFLKRTGRDSAEKDFVVLYQNKVVSFEAKSDLLPVPEPEKFDSVDSIKSQCEECINTAYGQSLEVKNKVLGGTAVFYDNSSKKRKVVLDLRNVHIEECMQIVVMYEEYLGIETNIEHICPQFDAWIIDVRTLEYILADTVGKGRFDYFVDYVQKRKNGNGLVEVQSGEEILVYNLYKQFPVLFEKNYGDIGISVHI